MKDASLIFEAAAPCNETGDCGSVGFTGVGDIGEDRELANVAGGAESIELFAAVGDCVGDLTGAAAENGLRHGRYTSTYPICGSRKRCGPVRQLVK